MKSVFKVKKIKNNFTMSIEDSMNLNSQMIKKEKDFLQFIRQKLDPTKKNFPPSDNADNEQNQIQENLNKKNQPIIPNKGKIDDQKKTEVKSLSNIQNVNSLLTKKEMNFTTCFNITIMNGQKELNKYNNLLGIGMIDGSVLVWDCELHTDKFLLQKNSRFEITSIAIDENYLICGSIKGQIYIYDLIDGKELFNCAHDPYSVSSFQMFMSFFPFMSIGFDENNRICLYN
jgi:WD40 repeat protein